MGMREKQQLIDVLKQYHDNRFTPGVYEHSIFGKAALLLERSEEVVRCKDCKRWKPGDSFSGDSLDDMQRIGRCPIMRFGRRENDFCCEGERRTDDERTG